MPTPQIDPITLELVSEGLIAIVREMRANVRRTAYSSIIYEGQDFSCVIVDHLGQLVAKAPADHPVHIFPIPWTVRTILERFGDDIKPGDVFLHNDPYTGGTHLNDVTTIYPVFLDRHLFAFAVARAHWGDIGGMTPGSISGQSTEIYQEGVRIPAIRIYAEGRPNQAALDLIFANVRGERQRAGDFTAALVSCQQAGRNLEAMAEKFGAATLRACLARSLERAEMRMREQIASLPDGTYSYEAYVESTGRALEPLLVRLTLTIQGDEITADLGGSSPQSEGPTNAGPAMAHAGVFIIAKSYLDPTESVSQGSWRPLNTHVPEGTFLNARRPAAAAGMSEVRHAVDAAMMGALAAAIPDAATADNKGPGSHLYMAGRDLNGDLFIFYEYPAGGGGAWNGGDGGNTVRNFQEGDFTSIQPIEAVENEHPLLVERCEIRQNSAGPGLWRGGFGLRRDVRLLADEGVFSALTDLNILGPHGICGGYAGAGNRYTVRRDGREIEPSAIPGKVTAFPLRRDDVVVMRTAGGGGYGDPLQRPVELVWQDVRDGYLTGDAARERYGVVITTAGMDVAATEVARAALGAQQVFATIAPWSGPEHEGARRILPVARALADRIGVAASDVVEIVQPRGAPLRAWARLIDEPGDRVYVGSLGLAILRAKAGDRFVLRRLNPWGLLPPET